MRADMESAPTVFEGLRFVGVDVYGSHKTCCFMAGWPLDKNRKE